MSSDSMRSYIVESAKALQPLYIHSTIPIMVKDEFVSEEVDLQEFVNFIETQIPKHLLEDVEVIYIGEFPDLLNRNAAFLDGAIYISSDEPTTHDILEDVIHEIAHSLEDRAAPLIYHDKQLEREFLGKRARLKSILDAEGYDFPEKFYEDPQYYSTFDEFLSAVVGYPTLLTLTMGLFASPYGATSLREYFANGFEKYYLGDAEVIKDISPVLYNVLNTLHSESND